MKLSFGLISKFSLPKFKAITMSGFVAGAIVFLLASNWGLTAQAQALVAESTKKYPSAKTVEKSSLNKSEPSILIVGDSLSAEYGLIRGKGWVALLGSRLTERGVKHQIVNASISGETTSGGRTRFNDLLQKHKPNYVVLQLGANDALRGLPITQTEANLKSMVIDAKKMGATVVIVGIQIPPNYGKSYTEAFKAIFPTIAIEQKTELVPFMFEGFADKPEFFQKDRIHPNESAHPVMLNLIWPAVAKAMKTKI
jgi:acyl-CoA thioesterase I